MGARSGGVGRACAVAVGVTALATFSAGLAACALSAGFGCGAAMFVASGMTSVVFTATSRNNPSARQLACSAVFGSGAGDFFAIPIAAASGIRTLAKEILNTIGLGIAGRAVGC